MANWNTQRYITPRQQPVQRPTYGGIAGSMAQRGTTPYQPPGAVAPAWTGSTVVGSRSRTPYSTEQSLANGQVPGTPIPPPAPPAHPGVAPIAQTMAARNVPVMQPGQYAPSAGGPASLQNFRIDPAKTPGIDPGFAENFNFLMDKYGPAQAYAFGMKNANQGGMMYGRDLQKAMLGAGINSNDVNSVINQTNQAGNYFGDLRQQGSNEYDRNANTFTFGGKYGAGGLQGGTSVALPGKMTTY